MAKAISLINYFNNSSNNSNEESLKPPKPEKQLFLCMPESQQQRLFLGLQHLLLIGFPPFLILC